MRTMNGLQTRAKKKPMITLAKARMLSLQANEVSYRDICQIFNCAMGTINNAVHDKCDGEKTRQIRDYIDTLLIPGLR